MVEHLIATLTLRGWVTVSRHGVSTPPFPSAMRPIEVVFELERDGWEFVGKLNPGQYVFKRNV